MHCQTLITTHHFCPSSDRAAITVDADGSIFGPMRHMVGRLELKRAARVIYLEVVHWKIVRKHYVAVACERQAILPITPVVVFTLGPSEHVLVRSMGVLNYPTVVLLDKLTDRERLSL